MAGVARTSPGLRGRRGLFGRGGSAFSGARSGPIREAGRVRQEETPNHPHSAGPAPETRGQVGLSVLTVRRGSDNPVNPVTVARGPSGREAPMWGSGPVPSGCLGSGRSGPREIAYRPSPLSGVHPTGLAKGGA